MIRDGRSHCGHRRAGWLRPPLKPPSQRAALRAPPCSAVGLPMSDLRDLYQEVILDHTKRPRNFRKLEKANYKADGYNPLCGDKITVYLKLEDGVFRDISFQGSGCAISTASASMMTESLKGKTK